MTLSTYIAQDSDVAAGEPVEAANNHLYLLYLSNQEEYDRLNEQQKIVKQHRGGNFDAPVEKQLKKGINVLDAGCGTGAWTTAMGHEYPQSTFHGIDISPAFEKMELSKPKNCSFGIHNISKPFPFPENHFDFVHQRFVIAGIFENDWQEEVKNVMHVVKPGGYLELTEAVVPDIINCGPKLRLLSDAMSAGCLEKGVRFSQGREIELHLLRAGAVNIKSRLTAFPFAHGGPVGEFWYKDIMFVYRHQFRSMVVKRHPEYEDNNKYEQLLLEVKEECIQFKSAMMVYSFYAQKPNN